MDNFFKLKKVILIFFLKKYLLFIWLHRVLVAWDIYLSIYLSIYLWLHWVFVAEGGLSLVAASGGYSLFPCAGFSLRWLLWFLTALASLAADHGL